MKSLAFVFSVIVFVTTPAFSSNIVIGDGNCVDNKIIIEQYGQEYEGGIYLECLPPKPEDSFRVRYFWLDIDTYTIIKEGAGVEKIKKLVGSSPKIWSNSVAKEINSITKQFSVPYTRYHPKTHFEGGLAVRSLGGKQSEAGSHLFYAEPDDDGDNAYLNNIPIFLGQEPLIWPDPDAYQTVFSSKQWPGGWNSYYSFKDYGRIRNHRVDKATADLAALSCVSMSKAISKQEFDAYWSTVSRLANIYLQESRYNRLIKENYRYNSVIAIEDFDSINESFNAISYFTSLSWPDDFLIKKLSLDLYPDTDEPCFSGASGLIIMAVPRKVFVLVASIEAMGPSLKIKGVEYIADSHAGLRNNLAYNEKRQEEINIPALKRNETLIIPLRIELRYDLDTPFLEDPKFKKSLQKPLLVQEQVNGFPSDIIFEAENSAFNVIKAPEAYRPPGRTPVTQTYYFKEALKLNQLQVAETYYPVRETPKHALFTEAGFDAGSCPFVYFTNAHGKKVLHGRILRNATDESKELTEKVNFPRGTRSFELVEKEPEISFIKTIKLVTKKENLLVAQDLILKPGQVLSFDIPEKFHSDEVVVEFTGYYVDISKVN
ncbi:hypothetical protein PSE_1965 [Pseudovibrio sp. FO-BEG1]|uniref:hypothetical protein n=1 Tax=Pseudovibrio sp. (strain FO-BEG1) TaxID=911045 RepID=UPI000238BD96|nr:hypothetical protein [Pseudovibrio sp. FO-BEG1]AEV36475.1 hypothetical protein PSE_1965 [Pseudovibrio sp. FO-BEG1]